MRPKTIENTRVHTQERIEETSSASMKLVNIPLLHTFHKTVKIR